MKEWYYVLHDQVQGPFPEERMKEMARCGEIVRDTLVRRGAISEDITHGWVKAAETELAAHFRQPGVNAPEAKVESAPKGSSPDPAPRWRRLLAWLLNDVIFFACELLGVMIGGCMGGPKFAPLFLFLLISIDVGFNLFFLYRDGQSIGKKMLAIRILRFNGSRASLGRILVLRNLPYIAFGLFDTVLKDNPAFLIIFGIFILVDLASTFKKDKRRLCDRLANTIVVRRSWA